MEPTQRQIDRVNRRTLIKSIKGNLWAVKWHRGKIKGLNKEMEAYKHELRGIARRLKKNPLYP